MCCGLAGAAVVSRVDVLHERSDAVLLEHGGRVPVAIVVTPGVWDLFHGLVPAIFSAVAVDGALGALSVGR